MPRFKRARHAGGTFFFTLVTHRRQRLFNDPNNIDSLRSAFRTVQRESPFQISAVVILPDHLHLIMTLPQGDDHYSSRIGRIKVQFTRALSVEARQKMPTSASRIRHREAGVWQRRFWEHMIRDDDDFLRHVEYIHYSPVRHRLAKCPHDWQWSSFDHWVKRGTYARDWACACNGTGATEPDGLDAMARQMGE
jgi:putative transposase